MDGRKRLSGAQYRKQSLEKAQKQEKVVANTQKIDKFFKPSTSKLLKIMI